MKHIEIDQNMLSTFELGQLLPETVLFQTGYLIAVAQEKFGTFHPELINKIRSIETKETLQNLLLQAVRLSNVQEFICTVEGVSKQQ